MSDENFLTIARLMMRYNFEIVDLPDDLKCVKCKLALKDACQVPCGCTFCRVCIDDMLVAKNKFCPGLSDDCGVSSLVQFKSDYMANIKVSKLTAKCVIDGCMQECELGNMEQHLRECPKRNVECPFRESGCEEGNFLAEEMNEHLYRKHLTHSEILIRMIANMKQDIEMLVQNKEESRKEFDMLKKSMGNDIKVLKQENENNKKEIELLRQKDEQRRKEIDVLKQRDVFSKAEIEELKDSLLQKDELINGIIDSIGQSNSESKSNPSMETPVKSTEPNLTDPVKELSRRLDREIDNREKLHKLELSTIKNGITETENLAQSIKDQLTNEINLIKNNIQIFIAEHPLMKKENDSMKTEIDSMKSQLKSIQALVGPVDASCEWIINQNVTTTSWEKGSHRSECFVGEKRPYKYQLDSWNGSGSLWIWLRIYRGSNNSKLGWPFEGRVVITVAEKGRLEACRSVSKQCKIWRPQNEDFKISDYFKFSHSELSEAGLDLSRGLCVSCVIVSIAGA